MKKIIRLTEAELTKLIESMVKQINEEDDKDYEFQTKPGFVERRMKIMQSIQDDSLSDHIKIYHMYKNGELDKRTFYSFVGILNRQEKERLMDYINSQKEESLD